MNEETGPSIDSTILEERIAARRLRIARRIESLKRELHGGEKNEVSSLEPEKEPSKSRQQIEKSYQRLSKLISDGTELVSNVEVACDARETAMRIQHDEDRIKRIEMLEAEVEVATKTFDEITKKWEHAMKKDVPQELQKMLSSQQVACDVMIEQKNNVINDLQQSLKQKDDQYVKDLRKQAEDIDLVLERMNEQIKTLTQAYMEELDNIENACFTERKEMLQQQKDKWVQKSEERKAKEIEYMHSREKRVEEFDEQLQALRVQDAEEYNMVKIKLEYDVQILEQNLQQMKATYQLNQEKLEYNFQVLKKRDEENTITKSQQKRKITRLQDLLNNLKQKLKKQEHQNSDENNSLSDDLKRVTEQYKELQKKFRHFQATDRKKFVDIWKMNEEQIKHLVSDVLEEDRIIFEQQLGLDWQPPDGDFLQNVGPLQDTKKSFKSALDTVQEVLSVTDENSQDTSLAGDETLPIQSSHSEKLSPRSIKKMLELLCDESGFLVEAKLVKLLAPIEKDEQSLMKLDAIFSAIGIVTENDIYMLSKYLIKPPSKITAENVDGTDSGDLSENIEQSEQQRQVDLIHPNDVVKSLKQFVEDNKEPFRQSRKMSSQFINSSARDDSMDAAYWSQLASVIDEKRERVWDAMIAGFEKYSHVLTERAQLIQDTDGLKQQNAELRMLLHQYLNSKVDEELVVPPTRVLHLELSQK